MKNGVLICGSYSYDNIMLFEGCFRNHILPDKVHMLNISFLVPTVNREFGGCASNIAYNLNMLGGNAIPMATVGNDFGPYRIKMVRDGVNGDFIKVIHDQITAQAYITTDKEDNQITAFHPGAMDMSAQNSVGDVEGVVVGIISPDGKEGMIRHAEEMVNNNIPFMFDPGQQLPVFNKDELLMFINDCKYLAVNDYELQLLLDTTEIGFDELRKKVDVVVVTKGGEGSSIYEGISEIKVAPIKVKKTTDPTGCGDAYRAGFIYGVVNGLGLEESGKVASVVSGIKIMKGGTQNHNFDMNMVRSVYEKNYGKAPF